MLYSLSLMERTRIHRAGTFIFPFSGTHLRAVTKTALPEPIDDRLHLLILNAHFAIVDVVAFVAASVRVSTHCLTQCSALCQFSRSYPIECFVITRTALGVTPCPYSQQVDCLGIWKPVAHNRYSALCSNTLADSRILLLIVLVC